MPTKVWIVMGPEWATTVAALRTADSDLPKWLREEMEEAVKPAVDRAKQAVMRVDVQGGPTRSTGLRSRVAGGVGVRVGATNNRGGSYFRVYTSMADRDEVGIPRGLDQSSGWRHPLFGNRNYWYTSRPTKPGWFTDSIADSQDEIERGITNALERAAKLIGSAS